jgi:hypothetical protein
MKRRDLLKAAVMAVTGNLMAEDKKSSMVVSPSGFSESFPAPKNVPTGKLKIEYVRENIPSFQVPALRGARYVDTVPDTLDIAERAKLCINTMTSITDGNADEEVYWLTTFYQNPPVMRHDFSDWVQSVEGMMEALPLVRVATGSTQNDHVDAAWMRVQLKTIGPDGLVYLPLRGRPWSLQSVPRAYEEPVWNAAGAQVAMDDPSVTQLGSVESTHRAIATMTVYYLRDKDPMWKAAIEKMILRLSEIATDRGDYAYFPAGSFLPGGRYGADAPMPTGIMAEELSGRIIQGLAQYYQVTGFEPARRLAGKLMNYLRYHAQYYTTDGAWLFSAIEKNWERGNWDVDNLVYGGHGHGHGIGLISALEYGIAANDKGTLDFVKGAYEWAKSNYSSPSIGFFPEWFMPHFDVSETDTIADMVGMALKMSAAGVADYWDDADRWTRNHFSESQITSAEWIKREAERSPQKPVAWNETGDHVAERSVGAFAGWSTANDFGVYSPKHPHSIQHCCTGNSSRTMYYIWQYILTYDQGRLRINLLLNRASEWVDICSYIPYEGKIEAVVKKPLSNVSVRVPEWVPANSPYVLAKSQAGSRPITWEGRYLNLGSANPGEMLTVTFPISIRKTTETIGNVFYNLEFKGNTLISIDPPGKNGPLYERAYYRADKAPMRKVERFVPDEPVKW